MLEEEFLRTMRKKIWIAVFATVVGIAWGCVHKKDTATGHPLQRITVSAFPVYLLVKNITAGRPDVDVSLLLPASLGCPHDYVLTPQDMQRLAAADVLVVNGLGLEEFLGAPVEKANGHLKIVTATLGIDSLLDYRESCASTEHGDESVHEEDAHHGANPHLFASPLRAAAMVRSIAAQLSTIDTAGASTYRANAERYIHRLDSLAEKMRIVVQGMNNQKIVAQHGALDYIARDVGLDIVTIIQSHAGEDLSAVQLLDLKKRILADKPGVLLVEPQYPSKIGEMLSRETGVPVAVFDPCASGPESAPLDYYESVMTKNTEMLTTLGQRSTP